MNSTFFSDSIEVKFIKSVLLNSRVPLIKSVRSGDFITAGKHYIYMDMVIKCTKTGTLSDNSAILTVSDSIKASKNLFVTNMINSAEFTRVFNLNTRTLGNIYFNNYIPKTDYYDSDTHEYLGKYLRYLRDFKNLNLMPFYNCFSYRILSRNKYDFSIYGLSVNDKYITYSIPIQFNRKYSIALDCPYSFKIVPTFISDTGFIEYKNNDCKFLTDLLKIKTSTYTRATFKSPINYEVSLRNIEDNISEILSQYESKLCLLIQLPENIKSSIVVLEGDFGNTTRINFSELQKNNSYIEHILLDKCCTSDLSLLNINDKIIHPYADRLIEYLLLNVIDHTETINANITYSQKLLGMEPTGIWDNYIRLTTYDKYMRENTTTPYKYKLDITGYIDKDIENFLQRNAANKLIANQSWTRGTD